MTKPIILIFYRIPCFTADASSFNVTKDSTQLKKIETLCQGRSQGAEAVCAPWGFRAPAGLRQARAKTSAKATETLAEVTKPVRKPSKSTSGQSGPSDHLGQPEKNRAPLTVKFIIRDSFEYQGPSDNNQGSF